MRYVRDYILELTFADGVHAELDFKDKFTGRGGVFEPLQDVNFFAKVHVDPELGTLVWPNEVDLAPDVLYSQATGKPIPVSETV